MGTARAKRTALEQYNANMGRTRMTILRKRIDRLERNRPALDADVPFELIGLAPDVAARFMAAKAQGTFPRSLCDADLHALVALGDELGVI